MGSFSMTCCVSGLPIEVGDALRFMLLTENPYSDTRCQGTSLYVPRTYPIRAVYDDYGGIQDYEENFHTKSWLSSFQKDLIEVGIGDNECHDGSVSKKMSFAKLLDGVFHGSRVRVKREVSFEDSQVYSTYLQSQTKDLFLAATETLKTKRTLDKGVPTLRRVSAAILKMGYEVNNPGYGQGTRVDVVPSGMVRVRIRKIDDLVKIQSRLSNYATMICSDGSPSSYDDPALLVAPKAGVRFYRRSTQPKSLLVEPAMIREDVWQKLCALPHTGSWGMSLDTIESKVVDRWHHLTRPMSGLTPFEKLAGSFGQGTLPYDDLPFSIGLKASFEQAAVDLLVAGHSPSGPEISGFLLDVAETLYLKQKLSTVRYQWRPSYSNGPQFGEWEEHTAHLKALYDVCSAQDTALRIAREEENRKWAEHDAQMAAKKAAAKKRKPSKKKA